MADYHPLILRAVEGLEKNTSENRRALYERARTALVAQLRGVVPALDESEITRERLALEEAIRKVEAESARRAREEPRPPPPRRPPEPPRREEPRAAPPPPPPPPTLPETEPEPAREPGPEPAPDTASWNDLAQTSSAAIRQTRRSPADQGSLTDEAVRGFRDAMGDAAGPPPQHPAYQPAPPPSAPPQSPPPERTRTEVRRETTYETRRPQPLEDHFEPPPPSAPPPSFDFSEPPPPPRPRRTAQRGPAEEPAAPRGRRIPAGASRYVRLGVIALIGILLGAVVWWQRDTIAGAAGSVIAMFSGGETATQPQRAPTTPQQRPKITDRIGQPSTQPSDAPAVAQRVVLYEEDPSDPQGRRLLGTVVWRTEMMTPAPGRPAELAVRGDVDVPERGMKMVFTLRRNADASLPASHTIEIMFNLPADSPTGGVQNVPGVLMKQAEQTRGVPLAGLAVKVTPGFFLIGLSSLEADMQRNIQLLKERAWFDIPMVYANNRRAILAMEKGTPGERAFNEAFAAWRQ